MKGKDHNHEPTSKGGPPTERGLTPTPEMRPDGFYGPLLHHHRTKADFRRTSVAKQGPRKRFWRSR